MKITLNVPDDVLEELRELHAATYPEHRLKFSPWIVDGWRALLAKSRRKRPA